MDTATQEEKDNMAFNQVQLAFDQISSTMHMAMTIMKAFAKAMPRNVKSTKYSNTTDLKRLIRYRKRFDQLKTVHGQLRGHVLSSLKSKNL